ncbi:MAG TPA: hypothetical protein PLR44_08705 [Thermomicrobiales bacterium]|nr:hypothetical protein [Thermomicrobiales bacterium]HRA31319.1 hypothetical protein [Thermomicrobiales bacterium]
MSGNEPAQNELRRTDPSAQAFWDRHAKLSILLIAGVFYFVLLTMCATILILLWLR